MHSNRLLVIFVIVFIGLLGFGLILPLLPYYAETFGASPTQVGLLMASYAAMQLMGAPILGRMSDRFGRRPMLMLSLLGSVAGFILLGIAQSLWMLFLSRMVDGLTGGNISVAQAYIADVTEEKNRAKGFGLIGAAFGLGFIFGPVMGGLLSVYGFAVPAFAAAGLSFLAFLGVVFLLPESLDEERRQALAAKKSEEFTLKNLWIALNRPRVGPLLSIRFLFGLAFSGFQTIFPLYAQYQLKLDARMTGFVLTYVGVLVVLVQGIGIPWLSSRFSEQGLIISALATMAGALFLWAFTPNVPILLLVLVPLAGSGGVLNTLLNSALSKAVHPEEVGGMLGLSASLESLTRALAPAGAGYLLDTLGPWAPGVVGSLIIASVFVFAWWHLIANPAPAYAARKASMSPSAHRASTNERLNP
ncbi:MAG: MFS transporter [Anaerolineae bacterium]|nr:MFS transporter [Anaerolineae bacterium]MDW8098433.1 MFS transporter [Anaerolineae bacterium]